MRIRRFTDKDAEKVSKMIIRTEKKQTVRIIPKNGSTLSKNERNHRI